jgi:hypothetical protein
MREDTTMSRLIGYAAFMLALGAACVLAAGH